MVTFLVERTVPLPLDETWHRLTEWSRHSAVFPQTRVTVATPPPPRQGTVLVARTGFGPLAVNDLMEVTVWHPSGVDTAELCRLEKRGRVVTGWVEIEVRPGPGGRSRVTWREELTVRPLPRALDDTVGSAARWAFGRGVNRLLRRE